MTLAHVVYSISTDSDFASKMRINPERALAEKGWKLSKEEQAFLSVGLTRKARDPSVVHISYLSDRAWGGWR